MSTILDALRKVERERDSTSDATLDAPTISSEVRRRRRFPLATIVACAVLGFGGGAVLSWLVPSQQEIQVASLPEPPPPPDIVVPRPPLRAKVATPPSQVQDESATAVPAPAAVPPSGAAAPGPSGVGPEGAPEAQAPSVLAGNEASGVAPPALDSKGSALEPSPFGPSREEVEPPPAGALAKSGVADAARAPNVRQPQDLAALAPSVLDVPEVPTVEAEPEPEPEPEPPAETLVDTGRSPPGAPKVALSFLQWSPDPSRRFAFISIDGAPSQRVREGEVAAGLTVAAITPTGVQFKREGTAFVIRPRH